MHSQTDMERLHGAQLHFLAVCLACSKLAPCCLLLAPCCFLLAARRLLLVARCSLLVACRLAQPRLASLRPPDPYTGALCFVCVCVCVDCGRMCADRAWCQCFRVNNVFHLQLRVAEKSDTHRHRHTYARLRTIWQDATETEREKKGEQARASGLPLSLWQLLLTQVLPPLLRIGRRLKLSPNGRPFAPAHRQGPAAELATTDWRREGKLKRASFQLHRVAAEEPRLESRLQNHDCLGKKYITPAVVVVVVVVCLLCRV